MASLSLLKIAGLFTSDNPHSGVPEGGLVTAENARLRYRNVIEPKRGQKHYESVSGTVTTFGTSSDRSNEGVFYDGGLVHHYATTKLARMVETVGATDYSGSYTAPDAATLRMKFVEAAQNLYFTTSAGLYLLDSLTATPLAAGVPRSLDPSSDVAAANFVAAEVGWMPANSAVRYVGLWGIKDANGNIKFGAPSPGIVLRNIVRVASGGAVRAANVVTITTVENENLGTGSLLTLLTPDGTFAAGPHTLTGGSLNSFTYNETAANATSAIAFEYSSARNTFVSFRIPPGITASHFFRLYRSEVTEDADNEPSENVYLVQEVTVDASAISSGIVTLTDRTPESMLQQPAYFNPEDGDGALAAKERPPLGKDVCLWDGRLWSLNTTDKHRFFLTMLGVGSPGGVQAGDTVTIGGTAYTADTTPTLQHEFQLVTGYSPQQNVEKTARALVSKINVSAQADATGIVAYYISGQDDAAGRILLERTTFGAASFTVYASRVASWAPALTTGSSGAQTSINDNRPHAGSFSEVEEPEAFPLTNWLPIAPKGIDLLRGIPFRDKLYVFAANGKAYKVTGPAPYVVDELDGGCMLIAPDSVKVHANQVFALTEQGVGVLSDAGFRIISKGIESELLDVLALTPATVKRYSFGASYESERQYQLWVPTGSSDTCAKRGFVYNSMDNTCEVWTGSRTWGTVSPTDGKLYMGDGAANKLRQERKTLDETDFVEEALSVTISSSTGTTVVLSDATGVTAGDMLWQSASLKSLILEVDGNSLTVDSTEAWTAGAASVLVAVDVTVKYQPIAPGDPKHQKNFRELTLHFREFGCRLFNATFDSEVDSTEDSAALEGAHLFGLGPYGETPYGNRLGLRNRRVEVTQRHNTAAMLRVGFHIREAYARWALHGFTVDFEGGPSTGRK